MYIKPFFIYLFLNISYVFSFVNKMHVPLINLNTKIYLKPNDLITYLTSIKEYTIITDNENNKSLEELMIKNDMNVYYVNLNNLLDKNEILTILKKKYNNIDTAENLWIFHQGFFLGSRYDINKIINKK